MSRHDTRNVNPDLGSERSKATFDADKLTNVLDGGEQQTKRRREIELMVLQDRRFDWPDYHFMDRNQKYDRVIRQCSYYVEKMRELSDGTKDDIHYLTSIAFPNIPFPLGLHLSMFTNVIENQTTPEQKAKWLPMARNLEIIGTYAQTELGHGTNVRALETTATYDPRTEEFIINSPTLTSVKFWPGGLGKTANYALVMAQLFTQGRCHGVHPFIVQLRDLKSHEPLKGVTVGDIGPKFGYETMDNGFLRFDQFRIPRVNMVMKNAKVERDGRFVKSSTSSKLAYGAMVQTRAAIAGALAGRHLAKAVTIAVRYSSVRRQSELKPGHPESKILEFQTQQFKLFPALATAYAFLFAGSRMMKDYDRLNEESLSGNLDSLQELHATSSCLKSLTSYAAMVGIEQCRLACGGHGYSMASGIPAIYVVETPGATYEGENTVLYLQTARFLIKALQQAQSGVPPSGSARYLSTNFSGRSTIDQHLQIDSFVEAYKYRAASVTRKAGQRLSQLTAKGTNAYDAWNKTSVLLVKAAECHAMVYVIESFVSAISKSTDWKVQAVLTDLFKLYASYSISNSAADFMQDGYLRGDQLDIVNDGILLLLEKLRPNAVALVDAFDFHDRHLGSILGRYDGNVYENLYDWAARSPLNGTQVHKSFQYLKPSLAAKLSSKL